MPAAQTTRRLASAEGQDPRPGPRSSVRMTPDGPVLDLTRYLPGLFTLVAGNLSGGASSAYLSLYAVGIETWRVMVMLAIERRVTAQRVVQLLGADKGSISRTFKAMHSQGLLRFEADPSDRRVRHAVFTDKGRRLHDRIIHLALVREAAAISTLSDAEVETLRGLLRRVYENLPQVDSATEAFSRKERAALGLPADGPPLRRRGGAAVASSAEPPPVSTRPGKRTHAPRR
jgi:DNA-binding MarR family transcriptional regulator